MSIIGIDPQANGWLDDGSEGGAIRTREAHGPLVMVPLKTLHYYAQITGSAAATRNTSTMTSNPDGTGTNIQMQVVSGTGNSVRIWFPFTGSAFGVYFLRATTTPDFTVVVDGEAREVKGYYDVLVTEGITQIVGSAQVVTHDNLSDGEHVAEIILTGDASATKTLVFFGVLLDSNAGYQAPPRLLHNPRIVALTTADVAIPFAPPTSAERTLLGIRKVFYYNSTAEAVTVTIKYLADVIWKKEVPANSTVEFDPGGVTAINNGWYQSASATGVTATIIGGY